METLFQEFLNFEPEITDPETEKLAFLDRGYTSSPWAGEIKQFSARLKNNKIDNYPPQGVIPRIDLDFLSFLHEDVTEACLCVIQKNNCYWFGRRPTDRVQMWSTTKFLAIYYLLSDLSPQESAFTWLVKDKDDNSLVFPFHCLVDLIFTYGDPRISSNSLALMFKEFYPPFVLEHWLHCLTGNDRSIFRGGYGEQAFLAKPVISTQKGQELLRANFVHKGENLVSAYDLTRCLSHLAWIEKIDRYDVLITAMAKDTARYLDVALEKRSLHLSDVVILSKMGFGRSEARQRSELVYTALLSSLELSCCFTFKTALNQSDPAQEARYLDARMATEVTKTIGKLRW